MGKRCLLVDDANLMKNILTNILESHGHIICGKASNGIEAFDKYKELKPDIVLMDIVMNEMDGLNALKMITNYDGNANVIMCTAMGQKPMVMEAVEYGARDFIVKPFKENQIIEAVNKLL